MGIKVSVGVSDEGERNRLEESRHSTRPPPANRRPDPVDRVNGWPVPVVVAPSGEVADWAW